MSPSPEDPPVLRLKAADDLLEAVPYLLGFHPRASLVLIGLSGSQVTVTTRVDLAELGSSAFDPADEGWPQSAGTTAGWSLDASPVHETLQVLAGSGATGVIAVVYDDEVGDFDRQAPPWRSAMTQVLTGCDLVELSLVDALFVARGRWWSFVCSDEQCCPAQGRALAGDCSPAAAAATYAGLVAHPDRSDLTTMLNPAPREVTDQLYPLLAHLEQQAMREAPAAAPRRTRSLKRAIFAAARRADEQLFTAPVDSARLEQLCRFGVGLQDIEVRDAVWLAIDHGRLDGRALWREVGHHLPPPYGAGALFLFGWAEWRAGNSVLARIAAEQALELDGGYTAAELLLDAISHALDPHRTPRLRLPRSA
jgi:hypothetical protein